MSTSPVAISDYDYQTSCFGGFRFPASSSKPDAISNQSNGNRRPTASAEDYQALLNEGMKHLTFDEIQHEQEVLHGVANEQDLDETAADELLSSLEDYLNQGKTGTNYETAEQRNQPYVCNRELRMAFLRANRFAPKEAARKIINFFRYKQELFGDECLVRDITSKDLNEGDLRFLLEGYLQYSPFRDRSGRKIILVFPGVRTKTPSRTELRARFYMWANSVETMVDISKGMVSVSYHVSQYQDHLNGAGFIEAYDLFKNCIPVDVVGHHICTDNRFELAILNTISAMMPHDARVKTRIHFGSHTECQYLLSSYGITRGVLPLTGPNNEIDMGHHQAWLQQRIFQEQQQKCFSVGDAFASSQQNGVNGQRSHKNQNDVLCLGRVVKCVGNERLVSLARRYFLAYEVGSASSRLAIVNQIIDEIHSYGGRFLKLDNNASAKADSTISLEDDDQNVWIELSPDERCAKVTQLFRNFRRRRSRLMSPSTTPGSSFSTRGLQSSAPPSLPILVDSTKPEDVLFGQYVVNNPGNLRLRDLVLGVTKEYDGSERGKKKEIVLRLIATIHQSGGRFLMARENRRWEVVSEDFARERISKQFRNLRRKR